MARGINMPALVSTLVARREISGPPEISGATDISTAAWLTWRLRKSLRHAGVAEVVLMPGQAPERWLLIAIDVLQRRAGWNVVVLHRNPGRSRVFRLQWLGWGTQRGRIRRYPT